MRYREQDFNLSGETSEAQRSATDTMRGTKVSLDKQVLGADVGNNLVAEFSPHSGVSVSVPRASRAPRESLGTGWLAACRRSIFSLLTRNSRWMQNLVHASA